MPADCEVGCLSPPLLLASLQKLDAPADGVKLCLLHNNIFYNTILQVLRGTGIAEPPLRVPALGEIKQETGLAADTACELVFWLLLVAGLAAAGLYRGRMQLDSC